MSYARFQGLAERRSWETPADKACMICVVLDAGTHRTFSGIRLVIGCRDGVEKLNNLVS
jgi:hypothetical protein